MTTDQVTLWDQIFKPVVSLLLNNDQLRQLKRSLDWDKQANILRNPELIYPNYYRNLSFNGIKGGYLTIDAAVTYDAIAEYTLSPNETWVRQGLIKQIGGKPRRILDLGCGTGSTTLMLKQAFREAEVIGLDLSPYMLVMADYKAKKSGFNLKWRQGKAEATGLAPASFDLVTASFLLHEIPPSVAQAVLRECFRLLVAGGQVIILDTNQKLLRQSQWLVEFFQDDKIKEYANESIEAWMGSAGFAGVQTEDLWIVHQVTRGIKPTQVYQPIFTDVEEVEVIDAIPI